MSCPALGTRLKNIEASIGGISGYTTDDIPEGSANFYYTQQRFDDRFDTRVASVSGQASGLASLDENALVEWAQIPRVAETVFVGKDGASDFQSIADALDAITDASGTKPYAVYVGPGLFTERLITMKPFIRLIGAGPGITRVRPQGVNQRLFELAPNSEVHGLSAVEKTGSEPVFSLANSIGIGLTRLSFIQFGQAETLLVLRDGTFDSVLQADHLFSSSATNFSTAFDVASVSGNIASLTLRDSVFVDIAAPMGGTFVAASGVKANVALQDVTAAMIASAGYGVDVTGGANIDASGLTLEGFARGVWIRAAATPNHVSLMATRIRSSGVLDIDVAQTTAQGSFQGEAQRLKVFSAAPLFAFAYTDSVEAGLVVTRKFLVGLEHGSITDLTPALLKSLPTGFLTGGQISSVSGLDVSVAAGDGYALKDGVISFIMWPTTTLTLPSDGSSSILVSNTGTVYSTNVEGFSTAENIVLGRVVTESGFTRFVQPIGRAAMNLASRIDDVNRKYLGPIFRQGSITSTGVTPGTLDVSSGSYAYGTSEFSPVGAAPITFSAWYRDGLGGYFTVDAITVVPNNQYDNNSGALATVPANQYTKHLVFVVNDGASETYLLAFGQTTFSTQVLAEAGALPAQPNVFKGNVVPIASIIMRQGVITPVAIFDERPTLVSRVGTVSSTSVHANLTGLAADDHLQYLNRNGVRPMTGDLAMGGNAITGVGLVDGVDISDHQARHVPGGADAIPTGAPTTALSATTSNQTGSGVTLARADHVHAVVTGVTPTTVLPDATAATGTSAGLARGDHTHAILTAAPIGALTPSSANSEGTGTDFARADHLHNVAEALLGDITSVRPGIAAAAGTADTFARGDHTHTLPAAAAVGLTGASTNTEGTTTTAARSDHTHAISNGGTPTTIQPDATAAQGASTSLARADHMHAILCDAPTTSLSPAIGNTEGSGLTFARNDHTHAVATAVSADLASIIPGAAAAEGVSNNFVRGDHRHLLPTASAVGLSGASTSTEGTASSSARSDHTHAIANGGTPSTIQPDAAATQGASTSLARADHVHAIDAAAPSANLNAGSANAEGVSTSFARADHSHAIDAALSAAVAGLVPDGLSAAGTATTFARGDHTHATPCAAPTTTLSAATTNAEGTGTSFARNDHTHAISTGLVGDLSMVNAGDAAVAGTQNSYARSDHQHPVATAAPVAQTPAQTLAEGSSISLARADHVHNIPTGSASGLSGTSSNTEGTAALFARADHTHALSAGVIGDLSTVNAGDTAVLGTASGIARADHQHPVSTASAVALTGASVVAEGASVSLARADHTHSIANGGTPSTITPDTAAAQGASTSLARADHVHAIDAAPPSATFTTGSANAEGSSTSFARADHVHSFSAGLLADLSTVNAGDAAVLGAAGGFAKTDHQHPVATAAAVSLIGSGANAEGTSTSLARADHTHALSAGLVGDLSTVNAGDVASLGTADGLARTDHQHPVATATAVALTGSSIAAEGASISLARADHTHSISNGGTPSAVSPDNLADQGSSTSLARADHVHAIDAAAPTTTLSPSTANAEGTGTSFARNDHTHAVATALVAAIQSVGVGGANAAGSAASFARGDHAHALAVGTAIGLDGSSSSTAGTAASVARSDHTHAIANGGTPSTIQPDATAAQGTSTSLARSDHTHAIDAATAVTLGTANSEGSSTSFARADHVHAHGAQTDQTLHALATQTTAGFLSAADKTTIDSVSTQLVGEVSTTDATVTTVLSFPTASDRTYLVEVWLCGRRTGGTAGAANDTANLIRRFVLKNTAGTLAAPIGLTTEFTQRDQAAWNITLTVSGTSLLIRANGALNNNVDWRAEARFVRR